MNSPWPLYSGNSEVVNAIDITSVKQLDTGYGEITPANSFPVVTVTDDFMQQYRPVATGYLVSRTGGPMFYMSKSAFEAVYTKGSGGGLEIGTTATTAMAGNKTPTSTERGGVLQQSAEAALAAQTVTDIATAQTAINNIVTKVNSITTKTKAGGLTA